MNIAELKKLAGIGSEQKHETQQNISHTATALKQKEKQLGLKPGDREWFIGLPITKYFFIYSCLNIL